MQLHNYMVLSLGRKILSTDGNPETFGDHVDGGTSRFDKYGVIYQAMCANCSRTVNFFGTPGSWSTTNQATDGAVVI